MNDEVWKVIDGFAPRMVSNLGRVRGSRGGILALNPDKDGYATVTIYSNDCRRVCRKVHQLVAEAFIGPKPTGCVVTHINGIRDDNRVENLRYATILENVHDEIRHGTFARGTAHSRAKLTDEKVRAARILHERGHSMSSLAKRFGVSDTVMIGVIKRTRWHHVR